MAVATAPKFSIVRDPSVWKAEDFPSDHDWCYELSDADQKEILAAVERVKRRGLVPPAYGRDDFPIPSFGARLKTLTERFENGRGYFLLRGIPVERNDLDNTKMMYWGIGVHLGIPVYQNTRNQLMTHVEDRGDDYGAVNTRLYTTAAAANPHNDPSDVVGLLCVRKSPSGGTSMIASATAIYNEIVEKHPECLEILHRGFPHDLRGEGSTKSFDETTPDLPVYSMFEGKLSCCINSKSSRTAREKQGRPLTKDESNAIEVVERLCNDPRFFITMDFRPGDAQFLNNYVILHNRTAFQNGHDLRQRRLLLRLWLNLREGRPLAPGFGDRFNNGRGGVPAR